MNIRTIAISAMALWACSCDSNKGSADFSTWGEEFIEQEIPASAVEDGWTIKYAKFLVVLGHVKVADSGGTVAAEMKATKLFDHTQVGVKPVVSFADLEAKTWNHVSYEIAPATAETELGGATEADKQRMVEGGYSIFVEATATKGAVSKHYAWGFTTHTLFDRCVGEVSGKETDGVVVNRGSTDQVQLTIHGDHLYYDDLQNKEAKVRFDAIADADADGDGNVTLEELAKVKLAALPSPREAGDAGVASPGEAGDAGVAAGGGYGTGSAAGINDLRAFVTALSRTVGHFRGEGECFASPK